MHTLRLVHRWIGIVLALPMLLVAVSGGLLVFRDAYYRARWPVVADPVVVTDPDAQARTIGRFEARLAADGVRTIKFPRPGLNAFHVYLRSGHEALVHPASGEVVTRWNPRTDAAAFLFDLHAHLLAGATGEVVNGYAALALVFLGLSGLLLWVPRRRGAFAMRFALPRDVSPASLLRSHAATGVLLLPGVLLFALTGAGLVFYEPAARVASRLLDHSAPQEPTARVTSRDAARVSWLQIVTAGYRTLPESGPRMLYLGSGENPVITFRKQLPGEWHPNGRSYVLLDPYDGRVLQSIDARAQGRGTQLMHALYPVHAARTGGIWLVVLAVVTSAGLAWLAAGGVWSYLARLMQRRRADDNTYRERAIWQRRRGIAP